MQLLAVDRSLVRSLLSALGVPTSDDDISDSDEKEELVAGCLSCLAKNPLCLEQMSEISEVQDMLIGWLTVPNNLMCSFFASLAVCHMATNWAARSSHGQTADPRKEHQLAAFRCLPDCLTIGLTAVHKWLVNDASIEKVYCSSLKPE